MKTDSEINMSGYEIWLLAVSNGYFLEFLHYP